MESIPTLDHVTLFKTLKHLLDDVIKQAMEANFIALQNIFTHRMERILNQTVQVLANILAELMHRVVDQLNQDNTRLQRQMADLTRKIQSMVVAKTTPTKTPVVTAPPFH